MPFTGGYQPGITNEKLMAVGSHTTSATATAISAGNVVIKATPGRLCRVLVVGAPSANVSIFDNATTNSGTVIGIIPSTATVGQTFDFQMPANNGITVGTVAITGGPLTISWV